MPPFVRRLAPWVVGLGLLVVVAVRVPWSAFEDAIARGPHAAILATNVVVTLVIWCTDSGSPWASLVAARPLLAPLFGAGLRGHALAIASRLPHVSAIVVGYFVAMRVWGVPVPLSDGLLLMPGVVIAIALPISPGGLGTMQAAFVYFFA